MSEFIVLIVDDEYEIRNALEEFLLNKGFTVLQASNSEEALLFLESQHIDICILDIRLPGKSGLELLAIIREQYPAVEIIMMTAHGEIESVIQSLRLGAIDYFRKPFSLKELNICIEKTNNYISFRQMILDRMRAHSELSDEFHKLLGQTMICESNEMKELLLDVKNIAGSGNSNVLITGESGSGKDVIARAIHFLSPRKNYPFNAVNCASVPGELFESEFFGHTRGAFTGAFTDRVGWFEATNKGSLLLDEIGDMHLGSQPKLLRVLENKKIQKVGSSKSISVDVRVISATNSHLEKLVESNRFRSDLYYRLNSIVVHIPPLRERNADILPLFNHFLREYSEGIGKPVNNVAPEVIDWLLHYRFPGNVRELKHMAERAVILSTGGKITLKHFIRTGKFLVKHVQGNTEQHPAKLNLEELEKTAILRALKQANYLKIQTAKILNISRQALDRRLLKFGIDIEDIRKGQE